MKNIILANKIIENDIFESGILPIQKYHGIYITDKFKWK